METLRSPTPGSGEGPLGTERSLTSPLTRRTDPATRELFQDEVERAQERAGGARVIEERLAATASARRNARHAGFETYHADGGAHPASLRDESASSEAPVPPSPTPVDDRKFERTPIPTTPPSSAEAAAPSATATPSGAALSDSALSSAPSSATGPLTAVASGAASSPQGELAGVRGVGNATRGAGASEAPAPVAARSSSRGVTTKAQPTLPEPPDPSRAEHAASVLRQIRHRITGGSRHLNLELDPVELGRLSIHVAVRRERVAAIVRAESPETLELLERHLPELRSILADNGFETDGVELVLGFHGGEGRRDGAAARPRANTPKRELGTMQNTGAAASTPRRNTSEGIDTYA